MPKATPELDPKAANANGIFASTSKGDRKGFFLDLQTKERVGEKRPIRDGDDTGDPHDIQWNPSIGTPTRYWDKPPIFYEYPNDIIKKEFVVPFWENFLVNFEKWIPLSILFLGVLQYRDVGNNTAPSVYVNFTLLLKGFLSDSSNTFEGADIKYEVLKLKNDYELICGRTTKISKIAKKSHIWS
ncbi:hypothetical protein GIB67_014711 [Kingdonia uniflora]|uniref:Uncharacterized protein n=1 Tax=Kingdonia uniflora TaxID=39325 RepID=A0A7J7NVA6_9MAGN|nr:hypothetical protein GIB67_014711 [Kingdonia uniflora]